MGDLTEYGGPPAMVETRSDNYYTVVCNSHQRLAVLNECLDRDSRHLRSDHKVERLIGRHQSTGPAWDETPTFLAELEGCIGDHRQIRFRKGSVEVWR